MDKAALGKRLRQARKDKGLTSEKLSELCSINATYLRQIEAGTKVPSLPVFVSLCRELGTHPDFLLMDSLPGIGIEEYSELSSLLQTATPSQKMCIRDSGITPADIGHHLFQLRTFRILAAHFIDVDLLHAQGLHQNLLTDRVLLLGANPDIANLQIVLPPCPNRVGWTNGTSQMPGTDPIGTLFAGLTEVYPNETLGSGRAIGVQTACAGNAPSRHPR